jgi:beta-lactamase class A
MIERFISRRALITGAAMLPMASVAAEPHTDPKQGLADLERRVQGRLGVAILDTTTATKIEHRAHERFPICSVFKLFAAAAVLSRIDRGQEDLDRLIPFGPADLLNYAPIARKHADRGGMTISELCAASIEYSDNTAGNLLVAALGGPDGLTRYFRSIGDEVTRIDRIEPEVNTAIPGDDRDTTSPAAMLDDVQHLLLANGLSPQSRTRLESWLASSVTGRNRIRAGLPASWLAGDKTGLGEHGTSNDVAILRPPGRRPILVAAFITDSAVSAPERDAALAAIGTLIATLVLSPVPP